jgi:hypothetical protein
MGHWNGDRNCEPAQLTEVSARGGTSCCRRTRAQNPTSVVNPFRGGVLDTRKRRRGRAHPPLPAAGAGHSAPTHRVSQKQGPIEEAHAAIARRASIRAADRLRWLFRTARQRQLSRS